MQRYFTPHVDATKQTATILGADVHHIRNVMRFRVGAQVIVCDDGNHCYHGILETIETDRVTCRLVSSIPSAELPVQVDIAQGMIRRERFEYMIQKSAELGASKIFPVRMKRSVVKVDDNQNGRKIDRWNLIAKEASEQAHRSAMTIITEPVELRALRYADYDLVIVPYEERTRNTNLPSALARKFSTVLIVIGPEGGFDPSEVAFLEAQANVEVVGLGPRILRTETVSSYLLSVLSYVTELVER